jgi:hypothetical protein
MQTMTTTPQQRSTEGLATVSLVAGLAQFFFLLPATITAIVTGHMARRRIKRSQGALDGDGQAVAGLTLGYVGLAFQVLIIAALALVVVARGDVKVERIGAALPAALFAGEVQQDATSHGLATPRNAEAVARVVDHNPVYETARLADGTPIARATQTQLERNHWRVEFGTDAAPECVTIPAGLNEQPLVTSGAC